MCGEATAQQPSVRGLLVGGWRGRQQPALHGNPTAAAGAARTCGAGKGRSWFWIERCQLGRCGSVDFLVQRIDGWTLCRWLSRLLGLKSGAARRGGRQSLDQGKYRIMPRLLDLAPNCNIVNSLAQMEST